MPTPTLPRPRPLQTATPSRLGQGPFFENGFDSISFTDGETAPALPPLHQLPPSELGGRDQLQQLLARRSLSDEVTQRTAPAVDDPGLLLPGRFGAALKDLASTLAARADAARPGSPEAKILARAQRELRNEASLRELASLYRMALHQA